MSGILGRKGLGWKCRVSPSVAIMESQTMASANPRQQQQSSKLGNHQNSSEGNGNLRAAASRDHVQKGSSRREATPKSKKGSFGGPQRGQLPAIDFRFGTVSQPELSTGSALAMPHADSVNDFPPLPLNRAAPTMRGEDAIPRESGSDARTSNSAWCAPPAAAPQPFPRRHVEERVVQDDGHPIQASPQGEPVVPRQPLRMNGEAGFTQDHVQSSPFSALEAAAPPPSVEEVSKGSHREPEKKGANVSDLETQEKVPSSGTEETVENVSTSPLQVPEGGAQEASSATIVTEVPVAEDVGQLKSTPSAWQRAPSQPVEDKGADVQQQVRQKRQSGWGLENSPAKTSEQRREVAAAPGLVVDDNAFPTLSASTAVGKRGKASLQSSAPRQAAQWPTQQSKPREVEAASFSKGGGDGRGKAQFNRGGNRGYQNGWEAADGRFQGRDTSQRQHRDAVHPDAKVTENLGRLLTRILRHQAAELNIVMRSDGYVDVQDLLSLSMKTHSNRPLSSHTLEDVLKVVDQDNKQRLGIKEENGKTFIRASQGHSIQSVASEQLLKPIISAEEAPVCVHGTYQENLKSILRDGLKRMKRNHIHFATGNIRSESVISGMRSTSEILIYLDLKKALADGMKVFISDNGVILTEGFDGVVPTKYFLKVLGLPDMKPIAF